MKTNTDINAGTTLSKAGLRIVSTTLPGQGMAPDQIAGDHSSGDAVTDDALADLYDYCDSLSYMLAHCLGNGPGFEEAAYMRAMQCVVEKMTTLTEQTSAHRRPLLKGEAVAHD